MLSTLQLKAKIGRILTHLSTNSFLLLLLPFSESFFKLFCDQRIWDASFEKKIK